MAMRRGIVVATHPEDHSVDIVMSSNGARLTGVQVLVPSGSTRTGTTDLPYVPEKKDKWDVTERSDQEIIAVVDDVDGFPMVVGFLYPQINQILHDDPKLMVSRHQSDVKWSIDGDGEIQLDHPSGAYVRIGEAADKVDMSGKNSDKNSKIDRNTEKKVNVRIGLAGNMVVVTLTPDGDMIVKLKRNYALDADGTIRMSTKQTFTVQAEGDVLIDTKANATVKAKGDALVDAGGNVNIKAGGNATVTSKAATINAPSGTTINSPLLRVNGEVSAKDYHKG